MGSVGRLKSAILILTANYTNSHKLIRDNLCNLWLKNFYEAESNIHSLNYF